MKGTTAGCSLLIWFEPRIHQIKKAVLKIYGERYVANDQINHPSLYVAHKIKI